MSTVRPFPRVLVPVPGESLSSYIDRLAAMHQVSLVVMLHAVGMIKEERHERINNFGVIMSDAQMKRFCTATKMTREQVAAMLMSSYSETVFNLSDVQPGDDLALRKQIIDSWVYISSTHVCPQCVLENNGAWKLAWKLPWTFACLEHKCYLVPYCPGCRRRFRSGRRDHSLSPVFVSQIPKLGVCNNPMQFHESQGLGKAAEACGYALADIPVESALRKVLVAQKQINEALAGVAQVVHGQTISPRCFFEDLRSICALILYCAEASDLSRLSCSEKATFSKFAKNRNVINEGRRASAAPRKGERLRLFNSRPDDPKLIGAIICDALTILGATDIEAMAKMLKPLAERCTAYTAKSRWTITDFFRFSERIAPAFHLNLANTASFDRSIGNRSLLARANQYAFESRHVPQLLWETEFESCFSKFFPNVGSRYARRFCAMCLVKLCGHYTWGDTAEFLGLPKKPSIAFANRCVNLLTNEKSKPQFSRALHMVAKRLSECRGKIDYGQRRNAFDKLFDIPNKDWLGICQQAQITPGLPERRSKYAAIWVWSYLTEGDWTLAPALEAENTTNAREVYRRMSKDILVKCQSALIEYSKNLLVELGHSKE